MRHKDVPPPPTVEAPPAKADQVAQVVSINSDDSVTFRVAAVDPATQVPLAEIAVVYATTPPPEGAGVAWFDDPANAFPFGFVELPLGFSGDATVDVPGVPYGISFVQVIWGYDE